MKLSNRECAVFLKELAGVLNAGLGTTEGLSIIAEDLENKKFKERLEVSIKALEEGDNRKARYFAEKLGAIAGIFEMGKYHECSSMLDVVCAEKNTMETYRVVEQLLKSTDSLCDFEKSELFRHMKFSKPKSSFAEDLKQKLLEGFRDEESFGYMKGNIAWEELIRPSEN